MAHEMNVRTARIKITAMKGPIEPDEQLGQLDGASGLVVFVVIVEAGAGSCCCGKAVAAVAIAPGVNERHRVTLRH